MKHFHGFAIGHTPIQLNFSVAVWPRSLASIAALVAISACSSSVDQGAPFTPSASKSTVTGTHRKMAPHVWCGLPCTYPDVYVANASQDRVVMWSNTQFNGRIITANLHGTNTKLNDPEAIATDAVGNLYVANSGGPSVTVYPAGADGNTAPSSKLNVPDAMWSVAVDPNNDIWIATKTKGLYEYAPGASGDATPLLHLGTGQVPNARGLAFDSSSNFYTPEGADGYVLKYVPSSNSYVLKTQIATQALVSPVGAATTPTQLQVADPGAVAIFLYNLSAISGSIYTGTPTKIIGNNTQLSIPAGVTSDASGNIWVVDDGTNGLYEYPPVDLCSCQKNIAPTVFSNSTYMGGSTLAIAVSH